VSQLGASAVGRAAMINSPGCVDNQKIPFPVTALARRHLRGYPLRNYHLTPAGRPLILSGPTDPGSLLGEPRVEKRFDEDDYMPYWSDLWPASVGLSDYMLASHLQPIGQYRTAVELGCGLGLCGVAAGMLGWRVIFTDYDSDALSYAAHNAASNNLRDYETRLLDWRCPPTNLRADLLLGADVIYEKRNHAALLACTHALLADSGVAIFADPHRDGAEGFAEAIRQTGFTLSIGHWADRQPDGHFIAMHLYFVRKER
jgi:SAM-dependent methyltransferase